MSESNINNLDQIRNIIYGDESQKIDKRFAQVDKEIKNLKSAMQASIVELESKLQKQADRSNEIEKNLVEEIKRTKSILEKLVQSESTKLDERIQELGRDKIDKQTLANLLIELALNLKGESLMNTLTQEVNGDGNQE